MNIKIDDIKIHSNGVCAEYIKKNNSTFNLRIMLNRPSDELRQLGYIKCENVLPVKFFFKHEFYLHDGYSTRDNHSWGNNALDFTLNSNNDINKIELNCEIKEVLSGMCKKRCIEAKYYKEYENSKKKYLIECLNNKVITIKGYSLANYVRKHNNKICGNEYEDYIKNLDNVCIEYKEYVK